MSHFSSQFLKDGYCRFRESPRAQEIAALSGGQAPKVMVIACSDSRVHPAIIFDSHPGEMFMVRNVANIVPPYETRGNYHGTSAALEFAVTILKIPTLLVLGHTGCGGARACLDAKSAPLAGDFIGSWVGIMNKARDDVIRKHADLGPDELAAALELAIVRKSLANLLTFPFVKEAISSRGLQLLGARFDLKTANLDWIE